MNPIGRYQFKLSKWQFDFTNKLSIIGLMNFILETAGNHATELGFSIERLMSEGHTWVLLRLRLDFHSEITEENEITIETWVDSVKGLFTTRRFNVYDSNSNLIASASTLWSMLDIKKRRMLPLNELLGNDFLITDKTLHSPTPEKTAQIENKEEPIRTEKALYSSIDINNHVTTTKYIQWVLDSFDLDFYSNQKIKSFEINFQNEAKYRDELEVFKGTTDNKSTVEITTPEQKLISVAEVCW